MASKSVRRRRLLEKAANVARSEARQNRKVRHSYLHTATKSARMRMADMRPGTPTATAKTAREEV